MKKRRQDLEWAIWKLGGSVDDVDVVPGVTRYWDPGIGGQYLGTIKGPTREDAIARFHKGRSHLVGLVDAVSDDVSIAHEDAVREEEARVAGRRCVHCGAITENPGETER